MVHGGDDLDEVRLAGQQYPHGQWVLVAHRLQELCAGHTGHSMIGYDDLEGLGILGELQSLFTAAAGQHLVVDSNHLRKSAKEKTSSSTQSTRGRQSVAALL